MANLSQLRSSSPIVTKEIARLLAEEIAHRGPRLTHALIVGLVGNLGTGKTTFTQGFSRGLGLERHLTSPTFIIIKSYKLKHKKYTALYHIDAYRIKKQKEFVALHFKEIFSDPSNLVLIEWADKLRRALPQKRFSVKFTHGKKEQERFLVFSSLSKT